MSDVKYMSGNQDVAAACSGVVFEEPFPGVNVSYILRQQFMQLRVNWAPLALNTLHPEYNGIGGKPKFYLVSESALSDAGGGVSRWDRTYARLPDSFSQPGGNYPYNFIGFAGVTGINVTQVTGRLRITLPVPVSVTRDFFLVGFDDAAHNMYLTWQEIPTIKAQRYVVPSGDVTIPDFDIDYLSDSPPLVVATSPSRSEYKDLMDDDASDVASFSLVVEAASPRLWMGNIYIRETMSVKAI